MRKKVPAWLFLVTLVWAVVVSGRLFLEKGPIPGIDRGHRCFAVANDLAAKTVAEVLTNSSLGERFTFSAGPTTQTVMRDNITVLIQHPEDQVLPPNGLSLVSGNPLLSAREAKAHLEKSGFVADIRENVIPELGGKLVMVTSNAFVGWALVFRRHVLVLGEPPNQRKITE